jgi:hypothetical protein
MSFDRSFSSYMNGCALNFLDSDHFLFACADGSGSLRLYKLDRTVSIDNGPAIHLATLHLPTLRAAAHIRQISFLTPAMQAHPRPHPTLATTDDPEARLHLLQIMYFCGDEGPSDEGPERAPVLASACAHKIHCAARPPRRSCPQHPLGGVGPTQYAADLSWGRARQYL